MKHIIAIDIGGTTFNTGLFSESFNLIDVSEKDKIRYHKGKDQVVQAIINQVNSIITKNNLEKSDIIGIGIASPGPLDSKKGIILNTPNLKFFHNYKIADDFHSKIGIKTFIENDANLFALGEWYSQYKNKDVMIGITLGTGFGIGLILNGKLYTGGNGFAMEYGLSPFKWGICEKNICREFIRNRAKELYGKKLSPVTIEEYYNKNDDKAIQIYNDFGQSLGIVLSHIINLIDPQVITIGGGLSKGFDCFKNTMLTTLQKHSPSFELSNIIVAPSKLREKSTMLGAAIIVNNSK